MTTTRLDRLLAQHAARAARERQAAEADASAARGAVREFELCDYVDTYVEKTERVVGYFREGNTLYAVFEGDAPPARYPGYRTLEEVLR